VGAFFERCMGVPGGFVELRGVAPEPLPAVADDIEVRIGRSDEVLALHDL
jgi:hypothetical protein